MPDRTIVLLAIQDSVRAERLAAAMEADGDFLTTVDAIADSADVIVMEAVEDGSLRISAGADGGEGEAEAVLPARVEDAVVVAAVRLVAAGFDVSPAARRNGPDDGPLAMAVDNAGSTRPRTALSARELEVLALLADGAPNKVIARRLDISVHTAKFHVASLLTKLGAVNRTDAIVIAMREGLVPV
ncbi:helix-turn-helix transcriptional regulator [Arvimicrobium flavum]|uniref:helix-turn-helix transcriptional regulator n=1 Tax=Arvimicrobium flavum TaxID=3393320 RepID=UPI00237C2E34|nr:helix-turn-helix transcriptional regulator [Mesorhizobium shangrilense]